MAAADRGANAEARLEVVDGGVEVRNGPEYVVDAVQ
jgi:hypothetical protein